jgi:hypothetical protein
LPLLGVNAGMNIRDAEDKTKGNILVCLSTHLPAKYPREKGVSTKMFNL